MELKKFHSETIPDSRLLQGIPGLRTIEIPGIKYGRKAIETMRGTAAQVR